MELWDIYDSERVKTGQTLPRGELPAGMYHVVIHVCIFNKNDEMLIQQRQPFKKGWSNLWDLTVGGSAVAGDTSAMAAERELWEEIGYRAELSGTRPRLTMQFPQGFDDYYLIEDDEVDLAALRLQVEEVQRVKWASKAEILRMVACGDFIPYHASLVELLFTMRGYNGAIAVDKT